MKWPGWQTVAVVLVLLLLPALGYVVASSVAKQRYAAATLAATARADSLQQALARKVDRVWFDTVRVDSIVTRWRTRYAVDTVRDSIPVPVREVIYQADTTIAAIDQHRRLCLSTLSDCQVALKAQQQRGDLYLTELRLAEAAGQRAARYRAIERGVCAGSVALNFIQWRTR